MLQQRKQPPVRELESHDAAGPECRERAAVRAREQNRVASLEHHLAAELRCNRGAPQVEHQSVASIRELRPQRRPSARQQTEVRRLEQQCIDAKRLVPLRLDANAVATEKLAE